MTTNSFIKVLSMQSFIRFRNMIDLVYEYNLCHKWVTQIEVLNIESYVETDIESYIETYVKTYIESYIKTYVESYVRHIKKEKVSRM